MHFVVSCSLFKMQDYSFISMWLEVKYKDCGQTPVKLTEDLRENRSGVKTPPLMTQ